MLFPHSNKLQNCRAMPGCVMPHKVGYRSLPPTSKFARSRRKKLKRDPYKKHLWNRNGHAKMLCADHHPELELTSPVRKAARRFYL